MSFPWWLEETRTYHDLGRGTGGTMQWSAKRGWKQEWLSNEFPQMQFRFKSNLWEAEKALVTATQLWNKTRCIVFGKVCGLWTDRQSKGFYISWRRGFYRLCWLLKRTLSGCVQALNDCLKSQLGHKPCYSALYLSERISSIPQDGMMAESTFRAMPIKECVTFCLWRDTSTSPYNAAYIGPGSHDYCTWPWPGKPLGPITEVIIHGHAAL